MTKKAWVENGIIRDICNADPAETYHPDIAQHYSVSVPEYCVSGALLLEGDWVNPVIEEPAPAPVAPVTVLSPLDFKLCFTMQERVLIKRALLTDDLLQVAFEVLDDPRLQEVDLYNQSTIEMIDYLVTINLITPARAIEVKAGSKI